MNGFYGSAFGNILGTLYFLLFQCVGFLYIKRIFPKKGLLFHLLTGSVSGSVLLQWIPALFAFFFGFSMTAHIMALLFVVISLVLLYVFYHPATAVSSTAPTKDYRQLLRRNYAFLLLAGGTFVLFCILLSTHTILPKNDGLHVGQCTYGDLQMHLGIITSIANQQTFPPYYSISPWDRLCYPFLCDSISSSIYLFGASLRYAYMLPMYFAFFQVITGFYAIADVLFHDRAKSLAAWVLFFYNGGLGFVYFIDWSREGGYKFSDIFTGYYTTPTNLVDRNIRWVNIIADMLLPQRATLFGYAVLFCAIWLLLRAIRNGEKECFLPAGILAGALPMIHTHSFVAILILSACWMLLCLYRSVPHNTSPVEHPGAVLLGCFVTCMILLEILNESSAAVAPVLLFRFGILVAASLVLYGLSLLYRCFSGKSTNNDTLQKFLTTWGVFFGVLLLLALPQLLEWTFGQTTQSGFLLGHFNWGNQGDTYLWFYLKNWGAILLWFVPAMIHCKKEDFDVMSGAFLLWFVVEIISFTPNTYDNNKLLYITYIFVCCLSADYGIDFLRSLKKASSRYLCMIGMVFLCTFSAVLTLCREVISDYTAYSSAQVEAAAFVEQNTSPTSRFLTNNRHVNEIAALAGRNVLNGAGTFLAMHGLYHTEYHEDFRTIYETPAVSADLIRTYDIDYIEVSSWERASYAVDENYFRSAWPCIFDNGEIHFSQLKFLYPLKTLAFPAFSPPRFGPFPSFFPLREEMRETFFRPSLQPYPEALRKFAWPLWWHGRKCSSWYLHQNVPAAPVHPWVLPREREGWSYMYASTDGNENHPYPRSFFGSIGIRC